MPKPNSQTPSPDALAGIISDVLAELRVGERKRKDPNAKQHGVYSTVDEAVDAAQQAHHTLVALPLEKRKEIIANIRKRCAEDVHTLAEFAHEETGLGRVEDKIKN